MKCIKAQSLIIKKSFSNKLNEHLLECNDCSKFQQNYISFINVLNQDYNYPLDAPQIIPLNHSPIYSLSYSSNQFFSNLSIYRFLPIAAIFIIFISAILYFHYTHNFPKLFSNNINKINNSYHLCIKDTPKGIMITWNNSKKSEYILYRSTNPKDFSKAKKIIVKGNKYLDKEAVNYPIVFYKIL